MSRRTIAAATFVILALVVDANAHLMPGQRATLNFVEDGAYLAITVPVSAFSGVDGNDDGKLSMQELDKHMPSLGTQVRDHVKLTLGDGAALPLEGLMISLSHSDHDPAGPAAYVLALGRFPVVELTGSAMLEITFWGDTPKQQVYLVTATRGTEKSKLEFSPASSRQALFASSTNIGLDLITTTARLCDAYSVGTNGRTVCDPIGYWL